MWANTNTHARSILLWIIDPNTFNFVRPRIVWWFWNVWTCKRSVWDDVDLKCMHLCIWMQHTNSHSNVQMTAHYEHTRTCSIQNNVCEYLRLWYLLDDKRTHTTHYTLGMRAQVLHFRHCTVKYRTDTKLPTNVCHIRNWIHHH